MAAEASLSSNIGRVLNGRYRLVAPIGSGASAHVLAARDEVLGRRVAIKLLHPALRGDGAFLERFRAEARAAAALSHPNIVAVYDWGEEDEPYLVLEYLAGGSLRELLDAGYRLSPAQAAALGAEVAGALAYAHRRGVVHRDVKPANLLFDDEGRSRVADFGLARALAEAAWTEPLGGLVGTARYASPEQAEGREVDGLADVYALALVLVEAITGEVPFAASTTVATLMARVGVDLAPPAATGPLARVLAAAGRARASERPTSGEVAALLEEVAVSLPPPAPLPLPGRTQTAPRPGPGGTQTAPLPLPGSAGEPGGAGLAPTLVGPPTAAPPSIGQPPAPRHRRRRRRWLYPAAALVVLLAAAGAAYGCRRCGG
jgi:serine/threonine protein kinase